MPRRPRILITRTRHQASELAGQLEVLGLETIVLPMIEVVPPDSFEAMDAALLALSNPAHDIDWLIFTSSNAVTAFDGRARAAGIGIYPRRIAAIGPATAKTIELSDLSHLSQGAGAVLVPTEYVAESLAESLLAEAGPAPKHFLLLRAEEARDTLPELLRGAGHRMTIAAAYRNVTPNGTLAALQQLFAAAQDYPDFITFTSSSTARNLIGLLESVGLKLPCGVVLASIGPVTSATLRELGYEPTVEAAEPTIGSLVAAIAAHL